MAIHPGILFFCACIPARIVIAYVASKMSAENLRLAAWPLFLVAVAFGYLFFTDSRMNAPEGGGVTWWANYRLVHAALYGAAAVYAARGQREAWIPLAIDVAFGVLLWISERPRVTTE